MQREALGGVGRILVVRLDNVGDVVMLGPAMRTLRARIPAATITLLASPAGAAAAALLPDVDSVIAARTPWQDASGALPLDTAREESLVASLRAGRFDAAFVFTSFSQTVWPPAYACYLAGIPIRVGQAGDFGGSVLTECVRPLPTCTHQVDRNLHLLEAVGLEPVGRRLEIAIDPPAHEGALAALAQVGIGARDAFVVAAPGASCPARRYDASRYAEALSILAERTALPVALVGHSGEASMIRDIQAASRSPRVHAIARDLSLQELGAVIARSRLLVGNNSAPMHLADAVGCPMVILYSGTDLEEQWRPRTAPAILLRRPTPCDPCYRLECPFHMECLDIPPREVSEACEELLARTEHRARSAARMSRGAILSVLDTPRASATAADRRAEVRAAPPESIATLWDGRESAR